jgi:hypothetical protein
MARGSAHHVLVYALDPPFDRHLGDAVIGQMVRALEHFLSSPEAEPRAHGGFHCLRAAPGAP